MGPNFPNNQTCLVCDALAKAAMEAWEALGQVVWAVASGREVWVQGQELEVCACVAILCHPNLTCYTVSIG